MLLLAGLMTRLAVLPMLVEMVLAVGLTKVPILRGGSADKPEAYGSWAMAHEIRTDWLLLLSLLFLLLVGPGRWSLDALLLGPAQPGAAVGLSRGLAGGGPG